MDRIATALIGCGKVGMTHALALSALPQSRLVAVCDADAARAESFAAKFGCKAYSDPEAMLASGEVQMVSICTPHPLHAPYAVMAAQAGVHALVEKPLAASLRDCDLAIGAHRAAGTRLGLVSQRRFYPGTQRIWRAIQDGKLGQPILGILTVQGWRSESYYQMDPWRGKWDTEGGGVLVNQTPHQLDILQWLMGPIEELYGYWDNFNHPFVEVEDTAFAVIRFKSGAVGNIVVSNSQNPGLYGRVQIHGSNGASVGVQTDGGNIFISGVSTNVDPPINYLWNVAGEEHLLEQWQAEDRALGARVDVMNYFHERQIEEFLQALQAGREPMVTGEQGRISVEIFTAIYRSQRDHLPIKFPVAAEDSHGDYDGRLSKALYSRTRQ